MDSMQDMRYKMAQAKVEQAEEQERADNVKSFAELREHLSDAVLSESGSGPPSPMQQRVERGKLSMAAAMLVQAGVRRLLVRARKARLIQHREVKRRRKIREAKLSNDVFDFSGNDMKQSSLRELHDHTFESIETTTNQMPAVKRSVKLRSLGCLTHRLIHAIENLSRVAAAPSEGAACDEMGLLLCDALHGAQCDVYPVESTEGQDFLKVNHRIYLPTRYHGVFHQNDPVPGKPVSYASIEAMRDPVTFEPLGVLEWYEPRTGFREMLVRPAEQDRIQATLRERGFKSTRIGYRVKELGPAMVIPVWRRPPARGKGAGAKGGVGGGVKRSSTAEKGVAGAPAAPMDEEDDESGAPQLVALILLIRGPADAPFDADEEYLASVLAPHLAHSLHRARLLAKTQAQLGQLTKLQQVCVATQTLSRARLKLPSQPL